MPALEALMFVAIVGVALWMRPWRWLQATERITPLLAVLVVLPWLWALPTLMHLPLQLQLSGACAVTLMLGWPLAVPVLAVVAALSGLIAPAPLDELVGRALWLGLMPGTLLIGVGALLRHFCGEHPFIYILGRAFFGTLVATFIAASVGQFMGHELMQVGGGLSLVGKWLMAWGDAFIAGMMAAIFVAFKPQWLATWSDALYLKKP